MPLAARRRAAEYALFSAPPVRLRPGPPRWWLSWATGGDRGSRPGTRGHDRQGAARRYTAAVTENVS
jgi:hypothetical protein